MKQRIFTMLFFCFTMLAYGQISLPPNGDNQKCRVSQWIGPVEVTITYHSPDVHGPDGKDRSGHIWGELVPYGFTDQQYGSSHKSPWRAGANENTTIYCSHDVKIEGKDLKAGTYGFFIDVEKDGLWTLIFSKNSESWGSFFYDEKEDALRVQAPVKDAGYTEWLSYGFEDRMPSSATAYLQWEHKKVPFKIEVPNVNDLHLTVIKNELRGDPGFYYLNWKDAALFCAYNKTNLEEGLAFADAAIGMPFVGVENYTTLEVKAEVLKAMGRDDDAEDVMMKAVNHPTATIRQVHFYGKDLLNQGKNDRALEVYKINRKNHPEDTFTTYVGLARGYTAVGDKKNAILNWEIAIKNVPESQKQNLPMLEGELQKLKENKK